MTRADTSRRGGLPADALRAVTEIAALPGHRGPALAPDGEQVGYLSDRADRPRLELAAVRGQDPPRVLSRPGQAVISASWAPDGQWLVYLVSPEGSSCAQLWAVRPDGAQARLLAGEDARATVFAGCWTGSGRYACTIAAGPGADVVAVDIASGSVQTLATEGFLAVTAVSADERTVVAGRGPRGRRHVVVIDVASGRQRRVIPLEHEGGRASEGGRFGPDERSVYLRAALAGPPGEDRIGLVVVDLSAVGVPGRSRVIARRPDADLDAFALRGDGTVLCRWNAGGVSEVDVRRIDDGGPVAAVTLPLPVLSSWSPSSDGSWLVAELTGPAEPPGLHVLPVTGEGAARRLRPIRSGSRWFARPTLHHYPAADGLELSGRLYTPRGVSGPNRTVVSFHGGPEGQDRPAWSPVTQTLVAAGLTVFTPNIRGSGGQGEAFMAADDVGLRESSFDDVRATVDHLVGSGIAAPGAIGAHGWSYGGYLVLVALTRWPDLFAAGASVAGMSDLRSFFAGTEPWMAAASTTEYGDPVTDREMLGAISPMTWIDRVRAPVLLAHGNRDTNVPVAESRQAHRALIDRGAVAELLLLRGEGHTVLGRENLVELTGAITEWFDRWLCGVT